MDDDKSRKNQRKPSQSRIPVLDEADADSDTLSLPAASAAFGPSRLLEAMVESGCTLDIVQSIRDWTDGGMLVCTGPDGVHVDCLKAVIPLFHRILERARPESFGEQTVRVADAESLLLLKLIAFRPLDQEDMCGILAANAGRLDLDWVRREATLAGIDVQRMTAFERMVQEFYVD